MAQKLATVPQNEDTDVLHYSNVTCIILKITPQQNKLRDLVSTCYISRRLKMLFCYLNKYTKTEHAGSQFIEVKIS